MDIKQNPFASESFSKIWEYHFIKEKPIFSFHFIKGLKFYRSSSFPIYINLGRNLTKGVSYKLIKKEIGKFKNSVILIYDVPDYFGVELAELHDHLKILKIKQYPGYLTDLKKYEDLRNFLNNTFSARTRSNLRRYEKRLNLCFDITNTMYYGDISRAEYDSIFKIFRTLLEKRYDEKKIANSNLNSYEWAFYYDVAFTMIQEKKASLFVMYEGRNPIAITLNYFSEDILFYGITVFDIDFSKFRIGKITLLKLFSWCFENNIHIFDFSKGDFDYKTRWMTKSYNFEYHIIYNSSSFISTMIGYSLKVFFTLKQYLREKELNTIFHQLTFWIKKGRNSKKTKYKFSFYNLSRKYPRTELKEISLNSIDHLALKPLINEFLFLNKEALKNLRICKVLNKESTYLFQGKETSKLLVIH